MKRELEKAYSALQQVALNEDEYINNNLNVQFPNLNVQFPNLTDSIDSYRNYISTKTQWYEFINNIMSETLNGEELDFSPKLQPLKNKRVKIRPDAINFLFLNFVEMIIMPLYITGRSRSDLEVRVKSDIKFILKEVISAKRKGDITSHTILSFIDENWSDLQVNKIKLWGKD